MLRKSKDYRTRYSNGATIKEPINISIYINKMIRIVMYRSCIKGCGKECSCPNLICKSFWRQPYAGKK